MSGFESNSNNQRGVRFTPDTHDTTRRDTQGSNAQGEPIFASDKPHWSVTHEDLNALNNARILMQYRIFELITRSEEAKKFDQKRMKRLASDIEQYIFSDTKSYQAYSSQQNIQYFVKVAMRYLLRLCDTMKVHRVMHVMSCINGNKIVSTMCNDDLTDVIPAVKYEEYNISNAPVPPNHRMNVKFVAETISRSNAPNSPAVVQPLTNTAIFKRKCNICSSKAQFIEPTDFRNLNSFDVYLLSILHLDSKYSSCIPVEGTYTIDGIPLLPPSSNKSYSNGEKSALSTLISLIHSASCTEGCNKPKCPMIKRDLEHARKCIAFTCNNHKCNEIKRALNHFDSCRDRQCRICELTVRLMVKMNAYNANKCLNEGMLNMGTCTKCGISTRLPQVRVVNVLEEGLFVPGSPPTHAPQNRQSIPETSSTPLCSQSDQNEIRSAVQMPEPRNPEFATEPIRARCEPPPKRQRSVNNSEILNIARATVEVDDDDEDQEEPVVERRPNKQVRKLHLRDPKSKKRSRDESDM